MPAQGMPPQGMAGGPMGAPMGGPMPGHMGGPMGGAPPQGGFPPYGGGYPGTYGAPPPAANDPMWGYFTAIAGQVRLCERLPLLLRDDNKMKPSYHSHHYTLTFTFTLFLDRLYKDSRNVCNAAKQTV